MRVWRDIWGPVWEVGLEVNLRVISEVSEVNLRVISEKPHRIAENWLHLAVGRAFSLKYVKYEVLGWSW